MQAPKIRKKKPSFHTVWEAFEKHNAEIQEIRELHKEIAKLQKETELIHNETRQIQKETEQIQRETSIQMKETDKQMKETDKRLGLYDNRYGKMLEHMVQPNLVKGFRKLGINVTKAYQNTRIIDENDKTIAEIDFTLEDGNKVIIVEVKSKLTIEDITYHVQRMEKVKTNADLHDDKRVYLGAIAGLVINDKERDFALKNGFYLIQPSGNTFAITVPDGAYSPREW